MRKSIDLWITDCITGEIKVIHDIDDMGFYFDNDIFSRLLFMHLKPYFDNQKAIKLEVVTK